MLGCGKSSTSKKSDNPSVHPQILNLGNGAEPEGLDPHVVTGVPEHNVLVALIEGLVGEDPKDLHPVPGVAASAGVPTVAAGAELAELLVGSLVGLDRGAAKVEGFQLDSERLGLLIMADFE